MSGERERPTPGGEALDNPSVTQWACTCTPGEAEAELSDCIGAVLDGDPQACAMLPLVIEHWDVVTRRAGRQ